MDAVDIDRLIVRWERALILGHESDYMKAQIGREIYDAHPGAPDQAWQTLIRTPPAGLGLTSAAAVGVRSMAAAIQIIPDRRVWLAGGWRAVRSMVGMTASRRKAACENLLKTAAGGRLKDTEVKVWVSTQRKPEDQPEKKAKKPAEKPEEPAPAETLGNATLDMLVAEIRKIVELAPVLRAQIDPKVARLVWGARKPRKTKAVG